MATGFLLSEGLATALRRPYHQGDLDVTMKYLVESKPIGAYRVMLKRNFDTACWVPPAGSRDSHSIYYGDKMLMRTVEFFCKKEGVELPKLKTFVEPIKLRLEAELKSKRKPVPEAGVKPTLVQLLDEQLGWVKTQFDTYKWDELLALLKRAVSAYGAHERQHARLTPKDMKQVNKDLALLSIPFKAFNLFEDARIEHSYREELSEFFGWLEFEEVAPANHPFNLFLRCIQLEGVDDTEALENEEPYAKNPDQTIGHMADSIRGYYQRACHCTQAEQLYPIIKEFLSEFQEELKTPPPSAGKGGGSGSDEEGEGGSPGEEGEDGETGDEDYDGAGERAGDLSTAADAAEKGDEFFQDFDADTEVVGGTDPAGAAAEEEAKGKLKSSSGSPSTKGGGPKNQGTPGSIVPDGKGGPAAERYFLTEQPGSVDDAYQKRVDNLTNVLMRMFKSHTLPMTTESETNRLSSRHLARGDFRFIQKKVFGGKGKRKYVFYYDCSGSMNGKPDREGKILLLAMNNLAKRGFLEGKLVLSGWVRGRGAWLSYTLPVADSVILRINPHHSSEGLQTAMEDNIASMLGMDDIYVITDACICDEPINRGQFAQRRIWPVGLYVGNEEAATEMETHFPQHIIRKTVEELVQAMLTRNRRSVG